MVGLYGFLIAVGAGLVFFNLVLGMLALLKYLTKDW